MYYPRKRAAVKGKKVYKRVAKRPYKRPATFAKKVKAVLARNVETKSIQFYQDNIPVSDYPTGAYLGTASTMFVGVLTPDSFLTPIALGTSSSQRIGNKITLSKVTLRGMITPRTYQSTNTEESPYNNAPEPFLFKMWIGYQKATAYNEPDSGFAGFFQEGGTSATPTGTLMDTFRKINTDKYTIVATRTFKVGPQSIITSQNTPVNANNQNYANNDFKFCQRFSFDVTKHCVKTVKYNDTNNQPNTRGLFWWVEAINTTGTNFVAGRFPAEMNYEVDIQYKDA